MNDLKLYALVSRFGRLGYRAKILLVAFFGTHVPLVVLIVYGVVRGGGDPGTMAWTLGLALVATLAGTGLTLLLLNGMLQPLLLTGRALRAFRESREVIALPDDFTDEAGQLMADASATLEQLDATLTELETLDAATGLINRDRLTAAIAARLAAGERFAVVVLRVDNLGRVQETYDRDTARMFARTIAERLRREGEPGSLASRVDLLNFGLLLPASGAARQVAALIERLRAAIALADTDVVPDFSAGIAMAGDDGADAGQLVDDALAAAASSTTEAVTFHSKRLREEARQRFVIEQELRQALARNQFALHFQPVVDLSLGRMTGVEALLRWHHPERGIIGPDMFVGAAERSGLIDEIGVWVVRTACEQAGRWRAEGQPLRVAFNVSARQFLDPRLMDVLTSSIATSGIAGDDIEVELTESAAMVDHDHTSRTFTRLRDMGVSIAIDDFGTGYASMSYLRKLPFDKLKIDREFVTHVDTRPDEQAICNAMIALAHGLGLRVLAEGTERAGEIAYLANRGCQMFQGYYFSKPLVAGDLAQERPIIEARLAEVRAQARLSV